MAKKRSSLASQSKVRIEEKNDKVLTEGSVFVETDAVLHDIETTMEEGGYRETKKQEITIDNDEGANAEVFKDKKFKRKKKKKTYEHTTWAHKMRVLGVLLVLGIFSGSGMGVWYFNGYLRARIDYGAYNPADYIQSADETLSANGINAKASDGLLWVSKAQSQGLTPADLTPADNFVLAQHNLSFASTYEINGFGYVDSTGVRQSITSRKKFNGSYYTFESISPSKISFIGDIILCDKYVKNGSIINTYNSNIKEPVKGDWVFLEDNTTKDYEFMNGSLPNTIQPYIISSKTVIDGTNDKANIIYDDQNGTYSFTVSLDPTTSVLNYAKQVKRTGGLGGYPEFEDLTITIVIDGDWNLLSFGIKENYSAIKGIRASCSGVLDYTVKINDTVEMPV